MNSHKEKGACQSTSDENEKLAFKSKQIIKKNVKVVKKYQSIKSLNLNQQKVLLE